MNKKDMFPIGRVAKMFHISESSLRHYERIGILSPKCVSMTNGFRYYGVEQFEVLNTIRYLRALDMPLDEIKNFLMNKDTDAIKKMLEEQKKAVVEKEKELKRIERKINHRLDWLKDAQSAPLDTIELVKSSSNRIAIVRGSLNIESARDMEMPIRLLDQTHSEAVIFLGKVGLLISSEHLLKGETSQYDGIFLLLDEEDDYAGETYTLPETYCVRLRFHGSHLEALEQYKKVLDYIHEHKMKITSFSREITLIDYGVSNDVNKFVTEISVPVELI